MTTPTPKKRKESSTFEPVTGAQGVDYQNILLDENKELILFRIPSSLPLITFNGTKISFKEENNAVVGHLNVDPGDGIIKGYELHPSVMSEYQTIYNLFPTPDSSYLIPGCLNITYQSNQNVGKPFSAAYEVIEAPSVPAATEAFEISGPPRPRENLQLHNIPIGHGTELHISGTSEATPKKKKIKGKSTSDVNSNAATAKTAPNSAAKKKKSKPASEADTPMNTSLDSTPIKAETEEAPITADVAKIKKKKKSAPQS